MRRQRTCGIALVVMITACAPGLAEASTSASEATPAAIGAHKPNPTLELLLAGLKQKLIRTQAFGFKINALVDGQIDAKNKVIAQREAEIGDAIDNHGPDEDNTIQRLQGDIDNLEDDIGVLEDELIVLLTAIHDREVMLEAQIAKVELEIGAS
jgi:hypothetical protein